MYDYHSHVAERRKLKRRISELETALEAAARTPGRLKYPEGHRQDDYVIAVNNACDRIEKEIRELISTN